MKYCWSCGNQIAENDKFCQKCGKNQTEGIKQHAQTKNESVKSSNTTNISTPSFADMTHIRNTEGLTFEEINLELNKGAKFVLFEYCFSILIMTFKRGSSIYFIKSGESTLKFGLPYTLISLVFGWWGIPWGVFYTIGSIYTNFSGGKNVTAGLIEAFNGKL